jgi:hypothetical protein
MYTTEDIENFVEENRDSLELSLAKSELIDFIPIDMLRPVFQSGGWLGPILRKDGATDEQIANICMCHGQRSLSRHPFAVAVSYANEFLQNGFVEDKCGEELAKEVNDEIFSRISRK